MYCVGAAARLAGGLSASDDVIGIHVPVNAEGIILPGLTPEMVLEFRQRTFDANTAGQWWRERLAKFHQFLDEVPGAAGATLSRWFHKPDSIPALQAFGEEMMLDILWGKSAHPTAVNNVWGPRPTFASDYHEGAQTRSQHARIFWAVGILQRWARRMASRPRPAPEPRSCGVCIISSLLSGLRVVAFAAVVISLMVIVVDIRDGRRLPRFVKDCRDGNFDDPPYSLLIAMLVLLLASLYVFVSIEPEKAPAPRPPRLKTLDDFKLCAGPVEFALPVWTGGEQSCSSSITFWVPGSTIPMGQATFATTTGGLCFLVTVDHVWAKLPPAVLAKFYTSFVHPEDRCVQTVEFRTTDWSVVHRAGATVYLVPKVPITPCATEDVARSQDLIREYVDIMRARTDLIRGSGGFGGSGAVTCREPSVWAIGFDVHADRANLVGSTGSFSCAVLYVTDERLRATLIPGCSGLALEVGSSMAGVFIGQAPTGLPRVHPEPLALFSSVLPMPSRFALVQRRRMEYRLSNGYSREARAVAQAERLRLYDTLRPTKRVEPRAKPSPSIPPGPVLEFLQRVFPSNVQECSGGVYQLQTKPNHKRTQLQKHQAEQNGERARSGGHQWDSRWRDGRRKVKGDYDVSQHFVGTQQRESVNLLIALTGLQQSVRTELRMFEVNSEEVIMCAWFSDDEERDLDDLSDEFGLEIRRLNKPPLTPAGFRPPTQTGPAASGAGDGVDLMWFRVRPATIIDVLMETHVEHSSFKGFPTTEVHWSPCVSWKVRLLDSGKTFVARVGTVRGNYKKHVRVPDGCDLFEPNDMDSTIRKFAAEYRKNPVLPLMDLDEEYKLPSELLPKDGEGSELAERRSAAWTAMTRNAVSRQFLASENALELTLEDLVDTHEAFFTEVEDVMVGDPPAFTTPFVVPVVTLARLFVESHKGTYQSRLLATSQVADFPAAEVKKWMDEWHEQVSMLAVEALQNVAKATSPGFPWTSVGYATKQEVLDSLPPPEFEKLVRMVSDRLFRIFFCKFPSVRAGDLDAIAGLTRDGWTDPSLAIVKTEPMPRRKFNAPVSVVEGVPSVDHAHSGLLDNKRSVINEKLRVVFAVSFVNIAVEQALFGSHKNLILELFPRLPTLIGLGHSGESARMTQERICRFSHENNGCFSSDVKNWDGCVTVPMLDAAMQLMLKIPCRLGGQRKHVWERQSPMLRRAAQWWVMVSSNQSVVLPDGAVIIKSTPGQMPSGSLLTTTINSLMRWMVNSALTHSPCLTCGDDAIHAGVLDEAFRRKHEGRVRMDYPSDPPPGYVEFTSHLWGLSTPLRAEQAIDRLQLHWFGKPGEDLGAMSDALPLGHPVLLSVRKSLHRLTSERKSRKFVSDRCLGLWSALSGLRALSRERRVTVTPLEVAESYRVNGGDPDWKMVAAIHRGEVHPDLLNGVEVPITRYLRHFDETFGLAGDSSGQSEDEDEDRQKGHQADALGGVSDAASGQDGSRGSDDFGSERISLSVQQTPSRPKAEGATQAGRV
jgi:hypothetical protein